MIKLVNQFDDQKMRASVATPTCGPCCCCSCCCCIATVLASSIITARNFGGAVDKTYQGKPETTINQHELVVERNIIRIIGLFILPVSISLTFALYSLNWFISITRDIKGLFILSIIFYLLGMFLFRLKYKISITAIIILGVVTGVLLFIEYSTFGFFEAIFLSNLLQIFF